MQCPLCKSSREFNALYERQNAFSSSDLFDFAPTSTATRERERERESSSAGSLSENFTQNHAVNLSSNFSENFAQNHLANSNANSSKTQDHAVNYSENFTAKGDCTINLVQCLDCGFIFNAAFNRKKVDAAYQSTIYYQQKNFTKRLNSHILNIAENILKFTPKPEKSCVLEIAPGHGDLLRALALSVDFIYSCDPSETSNAIKDIPNLEHLQMFFDYEALKNRISRRVDVIIMRHVIEHIDTPREILCDIVKFMDDESVLYIEVPNIDEFIVRARFYEIYNDHCGHYQSETMCKVAQELGLVMIKRVTYFDEQHQGFFFKKASNADIFTLYKPKFYTQKFTQDFKNAQDKIEQIIANYENVGIYGGAIHANTLLNAISPKSVAKIKKAFDANIDKQGRFLHRSKVEIFAPTKENLADINLLIMVMPVCEKAVFESEILAFVREGKWHGALLRTLDCREILVEEF